MESGEITNDGRGGFIPRLCPHCLSAGERRDQGTRRQQANLPGTSLCSVTWFGSSVCCDLCTWMMRQVRCQCCVLTIFIVHSLRHQHNRRGEQVRTEVTTMIEQSRPTSWRPTARYQFGSTSQGTFLISPCTAADDTHVQMYCWTWTDSLATDSPTASSHRSTSLRDFIPLSMLFGNGMTVSKEIRTPQQSSVGMTKSLPHRVHNTTATATAHGDKVAPWCAQYPAGARRGRFVLFAVYLGLPGRRSPLYLLPLCWVRI